MLLVLVLVLVQALALDGEAGSVLLVGLINVCHVGVILAVRRRMLGAHLHAVLFVPMCRRVDFPVVLADSCSLREDIDPLLECALVLGASRPAKQEASQE